ncbi:hypothetical protein F5148DRAFT_1153661 [Russula earlei]|uniref:Uncharacterized protein n=1 Tax=Russula earlei TaxID=71964 RepID=A0ACC0TT42_9AGAM|nr:hypothetical protein F5148DRAFT_1153661 [Russula earlei]
MLMLSCTVAMMTAVQVPLWLLNACNVLDFLMTKHPKVMLALLAVLIVLASGHGNMSGSPLDVLFLYKPLTTLQLPPFSTIIKPPCLALLPPLLNNIRLLHIKLSMPAALWAVLNSVGHLLAPQLPDNLFNFKDKQTPATSLLAPPPIITRSHSAAPGSGSGSTSAAASIHGSHSGSVSTPDLATNPLFPLPHPNRQYQHLPADLAAWLAALSPPPQQRGYFNCPYFF